MSQLPKDDAKPGQQIAELPEGRLPGSMTGTGIPDRRWIAAWSMQALIADRKSFSSTCDIPPVTINRWADNQNEPGENKDEVPDGLIAQAINQYGWNALLIDLTGEVLWTSVKGLRWMAFSTDPDRRNRWRRMVARWWQDAESRSPAQSQHIGCVWSRKRLWLTQWSASRPEQLLVAMLQPSQLRGFMHHRWLEVLAQSAS